MNFTFTGAATGATYQVNDMPWTHRPVVSKLIDSEGNLQGFSQSPASEDTLQLDVVLRCNSRASALGALVMMPKDVIVIVISDSHASGPAQPKEGGGTITGFNGDWISYEGWSVTGWTGDEVRIAMTVHRYPLSNMDLTALANPTT